MSAVNSETGLAAINGAQLYYEIAGQGPSLVMIHAGVADSRQWNHEFAYFARHYRVLRYDMRGYGKSEPVDGEYRNLTDLTALLDALKIETPAVFMGCSMGGGLAMDLALAEPQRVRALIMVGSGPSGLDLDAPEPEEFAQVEAAYEAQDWDRVAEVETRIWFEGIGRSTDLINPEMRQLAYTMNRLALSHEAKGLGQRRADLTPPAAGRLADLKVAILAIVGAYDIPYIKAAADYMAEQIPTARKVVIEDSAHLPNLDHPDEFRQIVEAFLSSLEA